MRSFNFLLEHFKLSIMSRELRSRVVSLRTTILSDESIAKLKQTKYSDFHGSKSNGNGVDILPDSDSSIQNSSSSSSCSSLSKVNAPRKGSNKLKQSSGVTGNRGEGSTTIVLQLDEILECDAPKCNYHTSFKNDLERHKKFKHELEPYDCQECDYVTSNKHTFALHVRAHAGKAPIKCKICDWPTHSTSSLRSHIKLVHETAERRKQGISRASEFGKRFKCSKCDFRAVGKQEIHLHNYSHETERKYKCSFPECDYRTKRSSTFREHVKRHDVKNKKEFQCSLCSKLFWTRPMLHNHIQSHTKERAHPCSKCKYVANYSSVLKRHMRTHAKKSDRTTDTLNTEKSLGVKHSGRSLATSGTAKKSNGSGKVPQNEATTSRLESSPCNSPKAIKKRPSKPTKIPEKNYKCDHCEYTSISKYKIIRHAVVHRDSNDKLYSCSFPGCDFKTNWGDYVKKHYRDFHKSTADLMCSVEGCGFQTKWQDFLYKHQRIHERKRRKNHKCPMCQKAFFYTVGLKRHINIHTGETKYNCSLCDYVSGESSNFYAHRRKYHAGQVCEPIKAM